MHLAAACTNGKLLPNMERMEPFNVIYQTAEDGLGDTVKPRLIEASADLDRVLVIDDSDVQLTLSDERIEKAIIRKEQQQEQLLKAMMSGKRSFEEILKFISDDTAFQCGSIFAF